MELVVLVVTLALLQFIYLAIQVGNARRRYGIPAPAMTGHPVFERHVRVQQNTMEQLLVFIPAVLMFAFVAENQAWPGYEIAAALGVVWIVGRGLYARSYVKDPQSRAMGFMLTFVPSAILLVGTVIAVLMALL
jgi:glutathione S-transferase